MKPKEQEILTAPYGEKLVNLMLREEAREEERARAQTLSRHQLSPRNICDLELLATGAFSPVDQFFGELNYNRVPKRCGSRPTSFFRCRLL